MSAVIGFASPLAALAAEDSATVTHRFDDVQKWVERFEPKERAEWQKPAEILRVLSLPNGAVIADLGAGTGYMIPLLSALVGELGTVYAVDVESKMLEYIEQRDDMVFDNVQTILAEPNDPKLPEGELDLVFVLNTWHHIDKRTAYLKRLAKSLKPSGRVVIVDWRAAETVHGPPAKSRLAREKVIREFEKGGWSLVGESDLLVEQYFLTFMANASAELQPVPMDDPTGQSK